MKTSDIKICKKTEVYLGRGEGGGLKRGSIHNPTPDIKVRELSGVTWFTPIWSMAFF
jgi:hypothetical protein